MGPGRWSLGSHDPKRVGKIQDLVITVIILLMELLTPTKKGLVRLK